MIDLFAALVVLGTFILIIRGAEVRLALVAGGAVLAIASGKPGAWFDAFAASMVQANLITVILPALGFAAVVRLSGCDAHLVRLVVARLLKMRGAIVPAAMLATLLLSIPITSAAGITAAVGVVLIPAMIAMGVRPAMAGAALIGGTWGAVFSPGSPHPALIADLAKTTVMDVILAHLKASTPAAVLYAVLIYLVARVLREDRGWASTEPAAETQPAAPAEAERVNYLRAAMPILPLALLIITLPQFGLTTAWLPKGITVLQAMIIGTLVTAVITRLSPTKASKVFFDGMGEAYGSVIGIIIAAGVFIAGLNTFGSIDRLIETLKHAQSAAPAAAMLGTFGIAVLSGSGDAAAIAFNKAMLPHAELLGMTKVGLGNIAWICASIGRGMSPVAAATAIAAGYAGVSVFDIAKRTALPAIAAALLAVLILALIG